MVPKRKFTEEEYQTHVEDNDGLCLACGEWTFGGCEPDAENYSCEACGKNKVIGAENALIMGAIEFSEDEF